MVGAGIKPAPLQTNCPLSLQVLRCSPIAGSSGLLALSDHPGRSTMRDDMAKVIVERPRIKPRNCRKGRTHDIEDMPLHEGMRRSRAWHGECKELNENLAPLRRYLARQVGRPWNKVYSEIAENLRVDNTVQQHVRDHLRDFVAIVPRRNIHGWRSTIHGGLWWQEFFVDPVTGLLRRTDQLPEEKARRRLKRHRPPQPVDRIALDETRELRRINGIWFELAMAPLPEPQFCARPETVRVPLKGYYLARGPFIEVEKEVRRLLSPPARDAVCGKDIAVGPMVDTPDAWRIYRREVPDRRYAIAKRTLSRRELQRHGLNNDPSVCESIAIRTQAPQIPRCAAAGPGAGLSAS
jgi:hypothetical protein